MADLAERIQELATVFADGGSRTLQAAIDRWRLISLLEFDGAGRQPLPGPIDRSLKLSELLWGMDELLRPIGEERTLVVELRLDGSGGYEFSHTFELESVSPTQLVLDADYRYPHHPRPGMPVPVGTAVTDRPTDPAVLATVRELVNEFVAQYTEIMGQAPDLGAGSSEEEILAAETAIGVRLPEDVRALYRTVHDDGAEHGLLGHQRLLSLKSVVSWYQVDGPGSGGFNDDLFAVFPVVFDAYPAGRVRRVSRNDWWITIATDRGGNSCAVDLDPAPGGTPGQLIEYGRDFHGPVGHVAESVTAVLRQVVTALRAGAYDTFPDWPHLQTRHLPDGYVRGDLVGISGEAPDQDSDGTIHRVASELVGGSAEAPYCESPLGTGDRPLADIVADLDDPLAVQQLYLNHASVVDLADLAPLRNLRDLSINRAGTARLALPHELPIERLSVSATVADIASLAGHPTLWSLTLGACTEPVTIEPLVTVPALAYLDLSAVEVTDLDRVAALPQLRVLTLNRRQWQYLRDRDALLPSALAAAVLSDHTPLADAVDWASWLRATGPARPVAPPIR